MTNSQNENDILLWRNDNSATPRIIANFLRIWHKKRNCRKVGSHKDIKLNPRENAD